MQFGLCVLSGKSAVLVWKFSPEEKNEQCERGICSHSGSNRIRNVNGFLPSFQLHRSLLKRDQKLPSRLKQKHNKNTTKTNTTGREQMGTCTHIFRFRRTCHHASSQGLFPVRRPRRVLQLPPADLRLRQYPHPGSAPTAGGKYVLNRLRGFCDYLIWRVRGQSPRTNVQIKQSQESEVSIGLKTVQWSFVVNCNSSKDYFTKTMTQVINTTGNDKFNHCSTNSWGIFILPNNII